mmetsp:Transcript_106691/g.283787  ORF Transcript_106691/g.283787 Transcript_106691/m.283787 type:complete len:294 (-) Transcript_106691:61-942(-)
MSIVRHEAKASLSSRRPSRKASALPPSRSSVTHSSSTGNSTSSSASEPTATRSTLRRGTTRCFASSLCERRMIISVRSRSRETVHSTEPPVVASISKSRPRTICRTKAFTSLCASESSPGAAPGPESPASAAPAVAAAPLRKLSVSSQPPCTSSSSQPLKSSSSPCSRSARRSSTNMPKQSAKVSRSSTSPKRKLAVPPSSDASVTQRSSSAARVGPPWDAPSAPTATSPTSSSGQTSARAPARQIVSLVTSASRCTRTVERRPPAPIRRRSLPATMPCTKLSTILCASLFSP